MAPVSSRTTGRSRLWSPGPPPQAWALFTEARTGPNCEGAAEPPVLPEEDPKQCETTLSMWTGGKFSKETPLRGSMVGSPAPKAQTEVCGARKKQNKTKMDFIYFRHSGVCPEFSGFPPPPLSPASGEAEASCPVPSLVLKMQGQHNSGSDPM